MEYKRYYEYFYNKTYVIGERKIKETLIKSKAKSLVFYLNSNIILETQNILISKKSNIRLFDSLNELDTIFVNSIYDYTENKEELTLKNNVYPAYLKIKNFQLPSNYSFNKFLSDFGTLKGLIDVVKKFQENSNQYQKMYEQNDLRDFKIIEQENIVIKDSQLLQQDSTVLNEGTKNDSKKNTELEKEIETLKFNISKLTEDEKVFLLHVYYNSTIKIPLTEYAKLMIIINNLDDFSIFTLGSTNNRFYDKLNKGINYYSTIPQRNFINSVMQKLEPFGLTNVNKALNLIKSKIK